MDPLTTRRNLAINPVHRVDLEHQSLPINLDHMEEPQSNPIKLVLTVVLALKQSLVKIPISLDHMEILQSLPLNQDHMEEVHPINLVLLAALNQSLDRVLINQDLMEVLEPPSNLTNLVRTAALKQNRARIPISLDHMVKLQNLTDLDLESRMLEATFLDQKRIIPTLRNLSASILLAVLVARVSLVEVEADAAALRDNLAQAEADAAGLRVSLAEVVVVGLQIRTRAAKEAQPV